MSRCARRSLTLVATLGAAAALLCASQASASAFAAPTLYVNYTNNCTFTITTDAGSTATSIAPGTYQLVVMTPQVFADEDLSNGDPNMVACDSFVQFQLTGPGVSIQTTLQQGDEDFGEFSATLLPSSTYVAQDNNQPTVTQTTFTTLASGSPTVPTAPSSSGTGTSGSTSSGGSSSALGSATTASTKGTAFVGTLSAAVSTAGKLSMTFKGKQVTTLTAGRYTITVTDKSKKSGFILQGTGHTAINIAAAGSVGKHTKSVQLTAGQWFYYPTFVGAKSYFIVIT